MTEQPAGCFRPGEFIREELKAREWTHSDLAIYGDLPFQVACDVVTQDAPITPKIARALALAFGTSPALWLNLQRAYDVWMGRV